MAKVDFKLVSERLVSKLNAIAYELDHISKTAVSADCAYLARGLLERFSLRPSGEFLRPDFDDVLMANDRLGSAIVRLRFCTPAERDKLLQDVLELHTALNDLLCIYGAFV